MPVEISLKNWQAWEAWISLDGTGRDIDGMSGFPLPLRIEAVEHECARHDDPEGIRWRLLLIEERALRIRREEYRQRSTSK